MRFRLWAFGKFKSNVTRPLKKLNRRYPSKFVSVSKARREVTSFARSCALLTSDIADIALAVGEACNNAAEHGHKHEGYFTVTCSYENGEFVAEIADEGCGFDPAGKGECVDPERLGMRGLGIFIMRSLMDDICFTKNHSGMCVRLTKFGLATRQPELNQTLSTNGQSSQSVTLGAVHNRLKALLELTRFHSSGRRQD